MQCGYCTPGFVVTSKALLDHNPDPTEEEISGGPVRQPLPLQHLPAASHRRREAAEKMKAAKK